MKSINMQDEAMIKSEDLELVKTHFCELQEKLLLEKDERKRLTNNR